MLEIEFHTLTIKQPNLIKKDVMPTSCTLKGFVKQGMLLILLENSENGWKVKILPANLINLKQMHSYNL
jgi:hypothetical protein